MSAGQPLFQPDEIERAKARLAQPRRPIADAIWFHAALESLKMDASRLQEKGPGSNVFAVDSVEIVTYCDYTRSVYNAFTFNGLLDGDNNWNLWLEQLDHLFAIEFFEKREEPFILLDSFFGEIMDVWHAIDRSQSRIRLDIGQDIQKETEQFGGFTVEGLRRIQEFIISGKNFDKIRSEFEMFSERFLPNWRVDFIDTLIKSSVGNLRFEQILRGNGYVYLREDSYGERAIGTLLKGFDWRSFQEFTATEDVRHEYSEIVRTAQHLLSGVARQGKDAEAIGKAAENDSYALADIHLLNAFLESQNELARVELITRSSLLHSLVRALPTGRLKVQLRHPLLLPEAFRFSEGSISTISFFAERFSGLLAPYLEDYWNEKPAASAPEAGSRPQKKGASEREEQDSKRAGGIACDFVSWLRDTSLIQVGSRANDKQLTQAYEASLSGLQGGNPKTLEKALIGEIKQLFAIIIQSLEGKQNPLTYFAFKELIRKNRTLASVVWERTFQQEDVISTRVIAVDNRDVGPVPFIAMRMSGSRQTRVFHLYSAEASVLIMDQVSREDPAQIGRQDSHAPMEVTLTKAQTLEQFTKLLETFDDNGLEDTRAFAVDVTLIVAMALASRDQTRTAISLVSTVLHELTLMLRFHQGKLTEMDVRLRLAYQELLLFRHYCERQVGIAEFRTHQSGMTTVGFLRGSVERNYARAQRDLDFAATLDGMNSSAKRGSLVGEARLRMVHMSGWIDMYLLTSGLDLNARQSSIARPQIKLIHRRDIWAALGYVKESIDDSESIRALRQKTAEDVEAVRYLAHLEARILQNALTMFVVLLFGQDVPVMRRLLDPNFSPHPEHVFKFRDWQQWWKTLRNLNNHYKFNFRLMEVFDRVLGLLDSVAELRDDGSKDSSQKTAAGKVLIKSMVKQFADIKPRQTGFALTLIDHILAGISRESRPSPRRVSVADS